MEDRPVFQGKLPSGIYNGFYQIVVEFEEVTEDTIPEIYLETVFSSKKSFEFLERAANAKIHHLTPNKKIYKIRGNSTYRDNSAGDTLLLLASRIESTNKDRTKLPVIKSVKMIFEMQI